MAALIPVFISALPQLLAAGEDLYGYISTMKTALSQDAAWTTTVDQQWQQSLIAAGLSAEWIG